MFLHFTKIKMKTLLLILVRIIAITVFLLATGRAESSKEADALRVYSLYTERSDYLREVSEWLAYNAEVDKAIWIDLQNACEKLTATDSLLICQLAVRNYSGLEVTLFVK